MTANLTAHGLITEARFGNFSLLLIVDALVETLLKLFHFVLDFSFVDFVGSRQLDRRSAQLLESLVFANDARTALLS